MTSRPMRTTVILKFRRSPAPKSITSVGEINRKQQIHKSARNTPPKIFLHSTVVVTTQYSFQANISLVFLMRKKGRFSGDTPVPPARGFAPCTPIPEWFSLFCIKVISAYLYCSPCVEINQTQDP